MPYANLLIAQAATSWIAAPFVVSLAVDPNDAGLGPYVWYIIAALGALIVWTTAYIGARLSQTIRKPTLGTLVLTLAFALAGTFAALLLLAPHIGEGRAWGEAFTMTPVAATLVGYMLHRGTEQT
jgi:uncharacterized membrane protein YfcA